jgi:hypothetical protein
MRRQPLIALLLAGLLINAVAAPILSYRFIQVTRELNRLKSQYNAVNGNTQLLQQLLGEAIEYGKKNPAIDPVLERIGVKSKSTTPTPTSKSTPK